MSARTGLAALLVAALVAACGGTASHKPTQRGAATIASVKPTASPAATPPAAPQPTAPQPTAPQRTRSPKAPVQALVTAETENRLLVVDLPSGRVVRWIALAPDPEDVAADASGGVVAVSSGASGKVTILARDSLRPLKVFGGFGTPHIVELAPDHEHVYVTDDTRGTLTVISLPRLSVTSTLEVGAGAHHLAFDSVHHRAWVALGESATTIVILDTSDLGHPGIVGRFEPGFAVHDLAFSPDGEQAWVTSAGSPDVSVFRPSDRRLLYRVPVGAPPQHVAFDGPYAYLTSGYGSTIELLDAATGRVLARVAAPYGSFELAAAGGYVVTSSLLRGTLAIYTSRLKLLRTVRLAPAAREVAISPPT